MKKIFVTGASGFLGGHIYFLARERWHVLAGYYNNPPAQLTEEWTRLDLTDQQKVHDTMVAFRPDVIIHAAANSNLDSCERDQNMTYAVNVESTRYLNEAAVLLGSRLIFVSSDMVFDGEKGNYRETDPVFPISIYGQSKVMSEDILIGGGVNAVIARAALIYGRPVTGGSSFLVWLENQLKAGSTVSLYDDQFRTPILVNNLAEALLELAENDFTGIIHLGGTNRIDRLTFGRQLCAAAGYNAGLLHAGSMFTSKPIAPRPADVSLNTDKAASVLHTRMLSTDEGLRRMGGV